MSDSIEAVVVDPAASGGFSIRQVPSPQPLPTEALVCVKSIAINPGEIRRSKAAPTGQRIGWDFAGIVEQPAADGSGPKSGARVAGMLYTGSWAQRISAPTNAMAEIPQKVSFSQAATLPVAGLTALHALYKGGFLLNRRVFVTGATGGTGDYACQLAKLAGAKVAAMARSPQREAFVRGLGVNHVIVGEDPSEAAKFGPYHLIVESVGGPNFGKILAMLAPRGTCVIFGTTAGTEPTINASKFYSTGQTTLYGMIVFNEFQNEAASIGMASLLDLVAAGKLVPHIEREDSWRNISQLTQDLTNRKFTGKAVLAID